MKKDIVAILQYNSSLNFEGHITYILKINRIFQWHVKTYPSGESGFSPVFSGILLFICLNLCFPILSSVLWYPLRFPHNGDIRFVFAFFTDTDIQHNSHKRWCSCCLSVTRRVPLVEQELLMFPDHLSSPILASCCEVCCRPLLVFISFLFWPFWCLYFFNLRLLIITLVSSRFSYILRFNLGISSK